jgi:hypothetical protein
MAAAPAEILRDRWLLRQTSVLQFAIIVLDAATLDVMLRAIGHALAPVAVFASFTMSALLTILAAIQAMRLPSCPAVPPRAPILVEAYAGVRYAWGLAPIRTILLLVSATTLLGIPYQALLPVFATDILHGDAHTGSPDGCVWGRSHQRLARGSNHKKGVSPCLCQTREMTQCLISALSVTFIPPLSLVALPQKEG